MGKVPKNSEDLQSSLWTISCQVRALGEMLLHQQRPPVVDEEEIWHGYGITLRELGERLRAFAAQLDKQEAQKSKRRIK